MAPAIRKLLMFMQKLFFLYIYLPSGEKGFKEGILGEVIPRLKAIILHVRFDEAGVHHQQLSLDFPKDLRYLTCLGV